MTQSLRSIGGRVRDFLDRSWAERTAVRVWITTTLEITALHPAANREVLLPEWERDGEAWTVELLRSCVVCGDETAQPTKTSIRRVVDPERALYVLAATFSVAVVCLSWSGWFMCGAVLFVGFILSLFARREKEVTVTITHCNQHASDRQFPELFCARQGLLVRFGKKKARRAFRKYFEGDREPENLPYSKPHPTIPLSETSESNVLSAPLSAPDLPAEHDPVSATIPFQTPSSIGHDTGVATPDELIRVIHTSKSRSEKESASAALGKMGGGIAQRLVKEFVKCNRQDEQHIQGRMYFRMALARIGDPAIPAITKFLTTPRGDDGLVWGMLSVFTESSSINKITAANACQAAVQCVTSTHRSIREAAAEVIRWRIDDLPDAECSQFVPVLLSLLNDRDSAIKNEAAKAIKKMKDRGVDVTASVPPASPSHQEASATSPPSKRDVLLATLDLIDGPKVSLTATRMGYTEEDVREGCWQVLAGVFFDAGRHPSNWSELRSMVQTHGEGYAISWLDLVLAQIDACSKNTSFPDLSPFSRLSKGDTALPCEAQET